MHGSFYSTSGKIALDPTGNAGTMEVSIDTSSVTTGYGKRDEHLKSEDFFNVAKFPTMTFRSNKLKYSGGKPPRRVC